MKRFLIVFMTSLSLLSFCSCSKTNDSESLSDRAVDSSSDVSLDFENTEKDNKPQTFTKDFNGIVLTVTTDKSKYNTGESINVTTSLENNSSNDINLFYGTLTTNGSVELMPSFESLIEYPIRGDIWRCDAIAVIPFKKGEKCVQNFTFQTYTGYFQGTSENGYTTIPTEILPDYDKVAESGVYNGNLKIQVCSGMEYPHGTITNYSLDFSVELI